MKLFLFKSYYTNKESLNWHCLIPELAVLLMLGNKRRERRGSYLNRAPPGLRMSTHRKMDMRCSVGMLYNSKNLRLRIQYVLDIT
jgi:hypothetical protein